jgi:hypothetical protein
VNALPSAIAPATARVPLAKAGADPAVVGDLAAIERHIQVGTHQDTPAGDHHIVDRLHLAP